MGQTVVQNSIRHYDGWHFWREKSYPLRGVMLLRELKMNQRGTFMDFCIESFRDSIIFSFAGFAKGPYIKYDRNLGGRGVGELQSV